MIWWASWAGSSGSSTDDLMMMIMCWLAELELDQLEMGLKSSVFAAHSFK